MSQYQRLGKEAMDFIKELESDPRKLHMVSLHEPTIVDLQQALDVLKERDRDHIEMIRGMDRRLERQVRKISELTDTIHTLETELATLRARGS